jgi:hypothetical protein
MGERADPCGEVGGAEFDATAIAAAPQGVLAVLCDGRVQPSRAFVEVSTDSGVVFASVGPRGRGERPTQCCGRRRPAQLGAVSSA